MMWSLATPTCVAPSASSCSVDVSTPDGRGVRAGVGLPGRPPEVLPEQLVGAVDEVHLHRRRPHGSLGGVEVDDLASEAATVSTADHTSSSS